MTAGRDTGGVTFALATVPLATIRGTVLLPPDTPGRGVSLGVSLVAPQRLDGYVTRSVRPRDDGSFELTRLAPGSYRVTARQFQQSGIEYNGPGAIEVTAAILTASPWRCGAARSSVAAS